jgi:hypothetical protein
MKKYLYGLASFALAFAILSVSLIKSSYVNFANAENVTPPSPIPSHVPEVDYIMALPGKVLPDSVLWPVKAARDRVWYTITTDHLKKADLALGYSDKRLISAKSLFQSGNHELGLSTITKGEKYMEMAVSEEKLARARGQDTSELAMKLANCSLKHREIIEKDIIPNVPEDYRPQLSQLEKYSKTAYIEAGGSLASFGKIAPNNPFEGL